MLVNKEWFLSLYRPSEILKRCSECLGKLTEETLQHLAYIEFIEGTGYRALKLTDKTEADLNTLQLRGVGVSVTQWPLMGW